jgi:hypothetical protein
MQRMIYNKNKALGKRSGLKCTHSSRRKQPPTVDKRLNYMNFLAQLLHRPSFFGFVLYTTTEILYVFACIFVQIIIVMRAAERKRTIVLSWTLIIGVIA